MSVALEDDPADLSAIDGLVPASVTVTRTSEEDFKSRQLIVWIDGERVADLLWGDSITRDLEAGPHRIRVSNTLVWKTVLFDVHPRPAGVLRSDQPARLGVAADACRPRRRTAVRDAAPDGQLIVRHSHRTDGL